MLAREIPAGSRLEWYLQSHPVNAAEAWRYYVEGVREVAADPTAPKALRDEARQLLEDGLSEDRPDPHPSQFADPDDDEEDPEGFGMDEAPEAGA